MTSRERIGKRIIDLRTEKKITQKQLAEKAGVTPNNLNRIEQGKYSPQFDTLEKIAEALECNIDFVDKTTIFA